MTLVLCIKCSARLDLDEPCTCERAPVRAYEERAPALSTFGRVASIAACTASGPEDFRRALIAAVEAERSGTN